MKIRKHFKLWLVILLIIPLILGIPLAGAAAGEDQAVVEVRELLRDYFVEPVAEDVLNEPTIKGMLGKLGDQNTQYMPKADYENFIGSLDRSFSGVGIELEMVSQGVLVTKAIAGYGADQAGIKAGDILIEADGVSLVGKTSEFCVSRLRGPAGSFTHLKVKRGIETLSFKVKRMVINMPLVEGKLLEDHIGYIAVYSFGMETVSQFDQNAQALKAQGADSWIIDLRNNGGGYTQAAMELLGYFIEDKTAVILKDRTPLAVAQKAIKQAYTLEGPIVLLANGFTASSSEITTGALKDHAKATIIGQTTYGSGRVKALMPLSNGDFLKMSVNRFFSPNNHPIDVVGISPHIDLSGVDELAVAVMLLNSSYLAVAKEDAGDKSGYIRLNAGPNNFTLSLTDLRKAENWQLGKKILDSAYVTTTLKLGGLKGWQAFPEIHLTQREKIYYPDYVKAGDLQQIPLDKQFTVTFSHDMDWDSVEADSVELIDSLTGKRIKCDLSFNDSQKMKVIPLSKLKANQEYWLVIHSSIKDSRGLNITGGVALAQTVK